jgi:hypothetical protein
MSLPMTAAGVVSVVTKPIFTSAANAEVAKSDVPSNVMISFFIFLSHVA